MTGLLGKIVGALIYAWPVFVLVMAIYFSKKLRDYAYNQRLEKLKREAEKRHLEE